MKKNTHGGARKGSGRKPTGRKRYEIRMRPETMGEILKIKDSEKMKTVGCVIERTYGPHDKIEWIKNEQKT